MRLEIAIFLRCDERWQSITALAVQCVRGMEWQALNMRLTRDEYETAQITVVYTLHLQRIFNPSVFCIGMRFSVNCKTD